MKNLNWMFIIIGIVLILGGLTISAGIVTAAWKCMFGTLCG